MTDRVAVPTSTGSYAFSPLNLAMAAVKFAVEHAFPLDEGRASLAHTFFWDVRKFTIPWVHESDQSLGQYLTGYNNVRGLVKGAVTGGYSSYLNSRGCAGVVTWTQWAKKGFEEDGVDPAKVSVIPPPFEPVHDRREHDGCNILFLGREFTRKGGDVALRAFRAMDVPGCRLFYVGGAEGQALKAIQGDRRITHLERPSGALLSEEVWPYVDILALPTRADAFAMAVVEAMSRGIPVVSSSIPPMAEVVEDGGPGYLVPVGDVASFSERLGRLAADPRLRSKMGSRAIDAVKERFSPDDLARRLMGVYLRAT